MRWFLRLLLFLFISNILPARSQTFNLDQDRVQMAELNGMWRFHTGDDPDGRLGWANPTFDDSRWALLKSDRPWSQQGYPDYAGMAWYRFRVVLPAKHGPLGIYIPHIRTSYQVFANGRLIGQYGGLPPHPRVDDGDRLQVFAIPREVATGDALQIAIRVWQWPHWAMYFGGGPTGISRIGDLDDLRQLQDMSLKSSYWSISSTSVQLLIALLAAAAAFLLFSLQPSDREYLWFGLCELGLFVLYLIMQFAELREHPLIPWESLLIGIDDIYYIFFLLFLATLLRQRWGILVWTGVSAQIVGILLLAPIELGWVSAATGNLLRAVDFVVFSTTVLAVLANGVRKKEKDAALLLIPVSLNYSLGTLLWSFDIYVRAGHPDFQNYYGWLYNISAWPFPFSVTDVTEVLMQLSVVAILIVRLARSRREEQRLASELEAARAVQQVLVPDKLPEVAGLHIDYVYNPAGEVGGDFFQALALPGGGLLLAIGDVSGKGMPAAMTVSMLVGAFRTVTQFVQNPSAILHAMNERMIGRAGGGFTTCLVARIDPDGACTLANAGHLHPYRNGVELSPEDGIPLGISAQARYPETTLRLVPSDRLTFLTDGVVEARSRGGELFGFARAASLANQPALSIAEAAQQFGQEDDMTVLTLTVAAAGGLS